MFNKEAFYKISDELISKITKFREESDLRVIRKDLSGSFIRVFKDSLFEYNDGIILLERFYKPNTVKYEKYNYASMKEEDKELLLKLEEASNSIPPIDVLSEDKSAEYIDEINKLCNDVKNIKPEYKDVVMEYIEVPFGKIPLKSIKELSDNEIAGRSLLSASLALSIYQSIFLVDDFTEGLSLISVEHDEYIDLVIVPYSNESEEIKKEEKEEE